MNQGRNEGNLVKTIRGPRARTLALAGTVLLASWAVPAGAGADDRMTVLPLDLGYLSSLVAGPDGAMWGGSDPRYGETVRIDDNGVVRRDYSGGSAHGAKRLSPFTPLADGSVGVVMHGFAGSSQPREEPALLRLRAGGLVASRRLPRAVEQAPDTAVTPSGAVWFARTCEDTVTRVSPSGAVKRLRLRPLGCRFVDEWDEPEDSQAIRVGVDGSLWIANQCQGRVVRIDRRERVREWRIRSACTEDAGASVLQTRVHLDADGGLRLPGVRIAASGSVEVSPTITVPDVVTADGSEWRLVGEGATIEQRTPDGELRSVAVGSAAAARFAWTMTAGADGRLWFLAGERPHDQTQVDVRFPGHLRFGTVTADGAVAMRPLPVDVDADGRSVPPLLAVGPDGRAWIVEHGRDAAPPFESFSRVFRLDTDASVAVPRARLTKALGRDGRLLWLQLACDAPAGRFCSGRLTLADRDGRALLTTAVPYTMSGGARGAVAASLSRRSTRALHRGAPLRARVTMRGAGSATVTQPTIVPR